MIKGMDEMKKDAEMNMTPMIDCVFLLMIFFVLVIDLSQQDLEALILPKAEYQEADDNPPEVRPIVNINQRGELVYKGEVQYDPLVHGQNLSTIDDLLRMFKDEIAKDKEPMEGNPNIILVNDPVLIRADKWTEWYHIAKLMERCSDPSLAFWKLELAMSEEDKELKALRAQGRD